MLFQHARQLRKEIKHDDKNRKNNDKNTNYFYHNYNIIKFYCVYNMTTKKQGVGEMNKYNEMTDKQKIKWIEKEQDRIGVIGYDYLRENRVFGKEWKMLTAKEMEK